MHRSCRSRRGGFRVYAYALYPFEFRGRQEERMRVAAPGVASLGPDFVRVGWDAVSRSGGQYSECSPLSCNLAAETLATNRYCIFR